MIFLYLYSVSFNANNIRTRTVVRFCRYTGLFLKRTNPEMTHVIFCQSQWALRLSLADTLGHSQSKRAKTQPVEYFYAVSLLILLYFYAVLLLRYPVYYNFREIISGCVFFLSLYVKLSTAPAIPREPKLRKKRVLKWMGGWNYDSYCRKTKF